VNMDETEKEIYRDNRFRRKALVGLTIALLALAGLADGLYMLHYLPTNPEVSDGHVHIGCPHKECQMPHLGYDNSSIPNGLGSGGLVVAYLALCAFIATYVMDDRA